MPSAERIYRRTEAGSRAFGDSNAGLPDHQRTILGLLEGDARTGLIVTSLKRRYSEKQILDYLDELQRLGLVESEAMTASHDLDFTGSLSSSDLRAYKGAAYA